MQRDEDRAAEALELERPVELNGEAVLEAAGRERGERKEDDRAHGGDDRRPQESRAAAAPPPHVREPDRNEHGGEELRRDCGAEDDCARRVALPEQRGESADRERRDPQIEAREHEVPEQQRRRSHEEQRHGRAQRGGDRRVQPERLNDLAELGVGHPLVDHLVGDLGVVLGLSGADHVRRAGRRLRVGGEAVLQFPRQLHLRLVGVRRRHLPDGAVLLEELNRAPVDEVRHRDLRDVPEGLLVVERRGEDLAGADQELGACACCAALVEQPCVVDGEREVAREVAREADVARTVVTSLPGREQGERAERLRARDQRHDHVRPR